MTQNETDESDMDVRYERHGREYRKDERESTEDEAVYSTRHRLYEIECPECGSESIEVIQWDEPMQSSAKAVCVCGFEYREDYTARDRLSRDREEGPVEHVLYEIAGTIPERWWSSWEFSPRLFLDTYQDQ